MFWFFIILAGFGILTRFIPHPANFTAISALTLFGAYYLNKKNAFLLPLAAMFFSDLFLGFYETKLMIAVYFSFALMPLLGLYLKKQGRILTIIYGSLLSALLFFIITNGAVFFFSPWYTKNINGLLQCFTLALPFFRNNILGNFFYSTFLFGSYELFLLAKKHSFLKKMRRIPLPRAPKIKNKSL